MWSDSRYNLEAVATGLTNEWDMSERESTQDINNS